MCCGSSYSPGVSGGYRADGNSADGKFEVTYFVNGEPRVTLAATQYEAVTLAQNGGGFRAVPKDYVLPG